MIESLLRSAPVAASTLSGKRRHGAESARGAGRHFDPYGEAAPRRGVCCCKTLAAAIVIVHPSTKRGKQKTRNAASLIDHPSTKRGKQKTRKTARSLLLQNAALALVVRQGCINLGVRNGRGLSSARGTAEAKACEMPVYLCTRQRLGH
jgi:hypothetical protein